MKSGYKKYTEEEKDQAVHVAIKDLLDHLGEEYQRSGDEYIWKKHDSVKFKDNVWFRHSTGEGGRSIDFLMKFYNMTYPEAMEYLTEGFGKVVMPITEKKVQKEEKRLVIPKHNDNMNRVMNYLLHVRKLDREIVEHFVHKGEIYEEKDTHNVVFAGKDREGKIRNIQLRGSKVKFVRTNYGSDNSFGFSHVGEGKRIFVFEAPIDMLSFISMNKENWMENSYVALNGVSQQALLKKLNDYMYIKTICLCLDNDEAGQNATLRIKNILAETGRTEVEVYIPKYKDWNEDLIHQQENNITIIKM